jgi:leucyl/phenylalanyl-tRNA--protein transferase
LSQLRSAEGVYWASDGRFSPDFPPTSDALAEPPGLLAIGGELSMERLLTAYSQGIFPWYVAGQPILWWSPAPRAVLLPDAVHVSRRLARTLRSNEFSVSVNQAFAAVISACANTPRRDSAGTWITEEMALAYTRLHQAGFAHSIECWHEQRLVGGIYGVALGQVFFGESMFSLRSNASKVALVHLCQLAQAWDYQLIDCQMETAHLISLGASLWSRDRFETALAALTMRNPSSQAWG